MNKLKAREEIQGKKSVLVIEREKDEKEKQADLEARLVALEARVAALEKGITSKPRAQ